MGYLSLESTTWNLKPLLEGDDDPKIEKKREILEQESYKFINNWKNRKDYLEDPIILKQALDEYESWCRKYGGGGDEHFYFTLRLYQNQTDPKIKARFNKIDEISKKIQNDIQFFTLGLAKIPKETQFFFLKAKELIIYHHFLERLFANSPFLLSEPEEKIMNLKSKVANDNWVNLTSGLLSKEERKVFIEGGKERIKNFSEILSLMDCQDKTVRDSAAKAFNEILKNHVDVAEVELNSILENKKINDELRGYIRPDISRHISDDIDSEVVDNLVRAVSKRYGVSRRYYKLKANLMKVKKLEYHEINVPYGVLNKIYSFEDASKLTHKVFKNLDSEFVNIFSEFIEKGRIDVFPQKGKMHGAALFYSIHNHPCYILLNHTNKLKDVTTLAHEMGHGIHYELSKKQNALNINIPKSTAEVASIFMEDFVFEEILRGSNDELKLAIMVNKMGNVINSVFRQIACYKFEQELHKEFREKGYLSKKVIGKLFLKHMGAYMGDSVELSQGSENWWVCWKHIRIFFYVYSFASGLLISKTLQKTVKKDPKNIKKIKEFLSAGSTNSPKKIFKNLEIDITKESFWNKGLDEIEELLLETENLAKKLKKIK